MSSKTRQPFYLFVSLYALYNDKDVEIYTSKFNSYCIKAWNNSVKTLKDQFKLTGDAVREVLYFAYVHNPLDKPYAVYGTVNTFYKVIPLYKRWRTLHDKEIEAEGFQKTLWKTKPDALSDLDRELMGDFEKVNGLY